MFIKLMQGRIERNMAYWGMDAVAQDINRRIAADRSGIKKILHHHKIVLFVLVFELVESLVEFKPKKKLLLAIERHDGATSHTTCQNLTNCSFQGDSFHILMT